MNFTSRYAKSKGDILDSKQKTRTHGKDMWTVLHTFSVFMPDRPSSEEVETFTSFIKGVLLYGTKLDSDWNSLTLTYIKENPFNFSSRDESMLWMCNFHNYINKKLEKDLFECTNEKLSKRWGNYGKIIQGDENKFSI